MPTWRDRTGEKRTMNCGMVATIIAYRNNADLDVMFEDGTLVQNKTYGNFTNGEISNPSIILHINESRIMTNGMRATVIAYRNAEDIDILFENGLIRRHVAYGHFVEGKISLVPKTDELHKQKQDRIGQTKIMKCGCSCTIIEYKNSHDISVRFDDGTIVKNRYYSQFVVGSIKNPNTRRNKEYKINRIGESRQMSCGMVPTVIEYDTTENITIQFEDGTIRKNQTWKSFLHGHIAHPNRTMGCAHVGETKTMQNGLEATIVGYRAHNDFDVEFSDGVIVNCNRYDVFRNGKVRHPNIHYTTDMSLQEFAIYYYLRKYGFRKIEQFEWKERGFGRMELDFFHETYNIAIEYDGGVHGNDDAILRDVKKNERCKELGVNLYRLRDPYCPTLKDGNSINYILKKENRIENGLFDCKEELEEILRLNDIVFSKDDIDFRRDKNDILAEYNETYIDRSAKDRVGQIVYHEKTKQNMTIIKYYSSQNMTVRFDDGELRFGVKYDKFKKGNIKHPSQMQKKKIE